MAWGCDDGRRVYLGRDERGGVDAFWICIRARYRELLVYRWVYRGFNGLMAEGRFRVTWNLISCDVRSLVIRVRADALSLRSGPG